MYLCLQSMSPCYLTIFLTTTQPSSQPSLSVGIAILGSREHVLHFKAMQMHRILDTCGLLEIIQSCLLPLFEHLERLDK